MKINFDRKMLTLKGKDCDPPMWPEPMTLGECCYLALRGASQQDQTSGLEQKLKLHKLMKKILKDNEADLTAEEVALLKDRIGRMFLSAEIVGVAADMLDPETPVGVVEELKQEPRFKETTRQ